MTDGLKRICIASAILSMLSWGYVAWASADAKQASDVYVQGILQSSPPSEDCGVTCEVQREDYKAKRNYELSRMQETDAHKTLALDIVGGIHLFLLLVGVPVLWIILGFSRDL
jgi:hypothetical protein